MDDTDTPPTQSPSVETLDAPIEPPRPEPAPVEMISPAATPRDSIPMILVSVLMLALVACLAVAHGWRKGYVLAPTDALGLVAPWAKGDDYVARNEQLLDQAVQFVPWTIYAVERFHKGQAPLWNPYSQLGAPLIGNGQSAVFFPTMLLHLNLPETWSWTLSAALRLFVAGLGVYVLVGRYGLRRVPRLLPAVAFMLCGFNVVWLNHPQTNVICLLPWAILVTEILVTRVTLPRILAAAAVFAIQFLGGHPATCIHLLVTCGGVLVLRFFIPADVDPRDIAADAEADSRHRRHARWAGGAAAFGAAVALGFALAAAQWLPLMEYASNSGATLVRQDRLKNEKLIAFDPRYLIGLAFPYANGFPDGVSPFELRRVTHLPNTNELAPGWVGTIPLLLGLYAAVALRRQRAIRLWTILGLAAAAIAIKLPGVDHVVRKIPGLNVAQNARLLVVTALALAILAGFGLESLLSSLRAGVYYPRLRKTLARAAIALAGIGVVMALVLLVARSPILNRGYARAESEYKNSAVHEHSLEHVKTLVRRVHTELVLTSLRLLIPAAILGLAAFLLWRHHKKGGSTIACTAWPWLCLATIDLLAFAIPYNPGAPADTYFPSNVAAVERLKGLPPARFAATGRAFMPETSTPYGLSDLRGYDALAPQRYYLWWSHFGIGGLPPEAQGYLSRMDDWRHPAWGLLNFGYLLTAHDQPAPPADQFKPLEGGGDANLYQVVNPRPRAWVAPRAETYTKLAPVLDRVARMDFKPDELVLLDQEVTQHFWESAIPDEAWSHKGSSFSRGATVTLLPPARGEEDRPEIVRLQVSGAGGGYLVLADSYFPGWTATISERGGGAAVKDLPVLPAYGVLRAVSLPPGVSSAVVEFRYRPWGWRIGLMISAIAFCLFILLAGVTMLPRRGPNRAAADPGTSDHD